MYEMLIVDDEQYVLDSLAKTYPWHELEIETVHTAASAAEALELLDMHNVHIVISDIRMPGLNGLELIERINQHSPKTRCLLLSGYSDFQYAQQAVAAGVEAYLLKPVKEDELMATVRKVVDDIRKEWEEIVSWQRIHYSYNEHLPLLRDLLLNDLIHGKPISPAALAQKLDMLQLHVPLNEPFSLMIVRPGKGFTEYDDHDRSLLEFGIANICEEIFAPKFALWRCRDTYQNLVFVVVNNSGQAESSGQTKPNRQWLEKYAVQLQDHVERYLKGTVSILISDWGTFPDDLFDFYRKSVSAIRTRTNDTDTFFINSLQAEEPTDFQPLLTIQQPPTMLHLLEAGRWDDAEAKLHEMMDEVRSKTAHQSDHLLEIEQMLRFSALHVLHRQAKTVDDLPALQNRQVKTAVIPDQLETWGLDLIRALRDLARQSSDGSPRTIILKINEFVQENLEDDVSLQSIADHIYLHPAYISKIYKQETGEKISDYIYRLRMERAAHLLRHTNERIQTIARTIGYQNPSHFSRVFKKYYQLTPDEYREQKEGV